MASTSLNNVEQILDGLNCLNVEFPFLHFSDLELGKPYPIIRFKANEGRFGRSIYVFLEHGIVSLPRRYSQTLTDTRLNFLNDEYVRLVLYVNGFKKYSSGFSSPQIEIKLAESTALSHSLLNEICNETNAKKA